MWKGVDLFKLCTWIKTMSWLTGLQNISISIQKTEPSFADVNSKSGALCYRQSEISKSIITSCGQNTDGRWGHCYVIIGSETSQKTGVHTNGKLEFNWNEVGNAKLTGPLSQSMQALFRSWHYFCRESVSPSAGKGSLLMTDCQKYFTILYTFFYFE